jgi:hypothetical protein
MMDFLGWVLGKGKRSPDRDPELAKRIEEASRIADESIDRQFIDGSIQTSSTVEFGSESDLTQAIDRVLELDPKNPDYLFAKSEAHYARLDGETGQAFRRKVLALNPNHFDAQMRERYFENWDHLFSYPGWSEQTQSVPRIMLSVQEAGNPVQIARDGIKPTVVVLLPSERSDFPNDVVDVHWKPIWIDSPYGPVFEHYVMLELVTGEIRKQELAICPYPMCFVHPRHGDWLIRRFTHLDSVFIAFNEGIEVIFNQEYDFPPSLYGELHRIRTEVDRVEFDSNYEARFQAASQWYMENSSLDDIAL